MNGFFQLIRNLGPARLLTLALIAAGTIAFFYYLANKVNAPEMGLLYSDLDLKDSGQIVQKLESLNVPYELSERYAAAAGPAATLLELPGVDHFAVIDPRTPVWATVAARLEAMR